MIQYITVYCASSNKVDIKYFNVAARTAKAIVDLGATVVYGGGSTGLMGKLADTALELGGEVKGIIPEFMIQVEGHAKLTESVIVPDMRTRKAKLVDNTDAIVVLADGCGTFDELFEMMTLKRLGKFTKPIIIINTEGYYDPFLEMMDKCINEHFMLEAHQQIWPVINTPEELAQAIKDAPDWGIII